MSRDAIRLAGVAAGKYSDSFVLRRARIAHPCHVHDRHDGRVLRQWDQGPIPDGHTRMIRAGDQYVEFYAVPPDVSDRYCAACAVAAGLAELVAPARLVESRGRSRSERCGEAWRISRTGGSHDASTDRPESAGGTNGENTTEGNQRGEARGRACTVGREERGARGQGGEAME